jgi:hypothetical protein
VFFSCANAFVPSLSASARRSVASRLAMVDLADAAAIAGIQASGQLRLNGRQDELLALNALERDVIDPSLEQSTTAVLDKISGATLVDTGQRQARIQLLTEVLEQLLVNNKQVRDAEAARRHRRQRDQARTSAQGCRSERRRRVSCPLAHVVWTRVRGVGKPAFW